MRTRAPGAQCSGTPSPRRSITPAGSWPGVTRSSGAGKVPSIRWTSDRQIPHACTRTRTSPGPGSGSGTSATSSRRAAESKTAARTRVAYAEMEVPNPDGETGGHDAPRGRLPLPWDGRMERADRIIVAGIALSGIYSLALLPLFPVLGSTHPALLELVRGSPASIVNMGARARIGEASFLLAVVLAVPTVMMFDWLFWWAGRRWGEGVFVWLLGGDTPRTRRRLARVRWLERRFGPFAVVLADILPIPSALVYAAVGDGGMRLWVFLVLDVMGTLLWTGLLATLGYELGRGAVDVTNAISHYSLWITLALVAAIIFFQGRRTRTTASPDEAVPE